MSDALNTNTTMQQLCAWAERAPSYPGTGQLVAAIYGESRHTPAWRPGRAGALKAYAEAQPRTWMTAEQFAQWFTVQTFYAKKFDRPRPLDAIGISPRVKLALIRGSRPVSKVEALACAHVAAGLEVPLELSGTAEFAEWVGANFGATEALARWLLVKPEAITNRIRGFEIVADRRVPREPEISLTRAMDWVGRMGPFCPYGDDQVRPALFPGHGE